MRTPASILSVCLLAAALPAAAQIYRWTDDRGGVIYGNHPPPGAARMTRLDLQGPRPRPSGSLPKVPREFPGSALPAPSEFPGAVDRRTVASVRDAIAQRDCAGQRARCDRAAAVREESFPELSALRLP